MTLNDTQISRQCHCLTLSKNGAIQRNSYNGILITRPTQQCNFEWPWETVSTGIWNMSRMWVPQHRAISYRWSCFCVWAVLSLTITSISDTDQSNDMEHHTASPQQLSFLLIICQIDLLTKLTLNLRAESAFWQMFFDWVLLVTNVTIYTQCQCIIHIYI